MHKVPKKRYRLETGAPTRITILLVGCGGTGSYGALYLAQLARITGDSDIQLVFIDPDYVEEKNVIRQNFCEAEIDQPKSMTLARRFSMAYGLSIIPVVGKFESEMLNQFRPQVDWNEDGLMLIVGCVDNTAARRDIHEAIIKARKQNTQVAKALWWLDAGNDHAHGQVLLGNNLNPKPLLSNLGFAFGLPLPSIQEPDLIASESDVVSADLSCAELVAMQVQARTINKAMASWLDVYCEQLINSRDLRMMATYLDQRSGSAYSEPIVDGEVADIKSTSSAVRPVREQPETTLICPECATYLERGRDVIDGVDTAIYYCPETRCEFLMPIEIFHEQYRN